MKRRNWYGKKISAGIGLCLALCMALTEPVSAAEIWEKLPETEEMRQEQQEAETEEIQERQQEAETEEIQQEVGAELDYFPGEDDPPVPSAGTYSVKGGKNTLPAAYDSRVRGAVSPVRRQGKWGTCWAHSVIACAESNILSQNLALPEEADLSERHLAYFTYHTPADPLGNAAGDRMTLTGPDNYLNQGGNSRFAAFTLANWAGFASEQTAPYDADGEMADLGEDCAYTDQFHLKEACWLSPEDMDGIKEKIMELGAASVPLYSGELTGNYYNPKTGAFYSRENKTGHVVAVVGWDDNYPRENFNSNFRPAANGAWLAKDSKGEKHGNQGYIWISYEDTSVRLKNFTFFELERTGNYQYNYHYDGTAGSGCAGFSYPEGVTLANIFTANAGNTGAEAIQAAGFAVGTPNVNYTIQVYKNVRDRANPESGIPVFKTPQTGFIRYCGYYTVPLKEAVTAGPGEIFAIVITLRQENQEKIWVHADYPGEYRSETGEVWCQLQTAQFPGQSLYRRTNGTEWRDAALADNLPFTLRIKALTSDTAPIAVSSISMKEKSVKMRPGEQKQLQIAFTPSNGTDLSLSFGASNKKAASVNKNGTVTAKSPGTCIITAKTRNGKTASCKITVQAVTDQGELNMPELYHVSNQESGIRLKWKKVSGADGYDIYRRTPGGKWKRTGRTKGSSAVTFTDKSVKSKNGKTYFYTVEARKGKAGSGYDDSGRKTVRLYAPKLAKINSKSPGTLTVTWKRNRKADGYQLQYSRSGNFKKSVSLELRSGNKEKKTIRKLKKKKVYYVRIRSWKKSGNRLYYSGWSETGKARVKQGPE